MLIPLVVLAAGAIFVGFLGVPEILSVGDTTNYFERFIHHSVAEVEPSLNVGNDVIIEEHGVEWRLVAVSSAIALIGIGLGWVSILDPGRVLLELDVPDHWRLVAYLCLGYAEDEQAQPELQREGWAVRQPPEHVLVQR